MFILKTVVKAKAPGTDVLIYAMYPDTDHVITTPSVRFQTVAVSLLKE